MDAFGDFCLYLEKFEFHKRKRPYKLGKKTFGVLVYLVVNRQRRVSLEKLVEKIWEHDLFDPSPVFQAIKRVKEALDEKGRQANFIRNFPTQTRDPFHSEYQFIGEVNIGVCDCLKTTVDSKQSSIKSLALQSI